MEKSLKDTLKDSLFFLKGVEEEVAENFLETLNKPCCFKKGETVCEPQKGCKGLGIVTKGRLEILAGERSVSMRHMEAPDVFGAASLFGGGRYVSTIRAASCAEVIFVEQEKLNRLLSQSFIAAGNYIAFLSEKIRFLNMRIENFTAPSATGALWDFLTAKASADGRLPAPSNMSRLAKTLNIGRTSLYRSVEELESSGKLCRRQKEWIIK